MPQASHESVAAYSAMLTTIRLDSFDVYRRHGCEGLRLQRHVRAVRSRHTDPPREVDMVGGLLSRAWSQMLSAPARAVRRVGSTPTRPTSFTHIFEWLPVLSIIKVTYRSHNVAEIPLLSRGGEPK